MDRLQQMNFIEYVRAARALAANPHSRATAERPWRVSVMWRDVGDFDGMNFHFATEADAQHALTVLVESFPDLVDLECSGVWSVSKALRTISLT
jgi:hypothetical protein